MADTKQEQAEIIETAQRLATLAQPAKEEQAPAQEEPATATQVEVAPKESPSKQPAEPAEKPDQTPAESSPDEAPLPSDPSEANRAFADMRRRNKELEQQIQAKQVGDTPEPQVAPPVAPMPSAGENLPQGNLGIDVRAFIDPQTGELDVERYTAAVVTATARQAGIVARQTVDDATQESEAYASYPELNPKSKDFDKPLYQATRGTLLDSMLRPNEYGGKPLRLKEAVEKVLGISAKKLSEAKTEGAEEAVQRLAAKEEVSLEATGNSGRGPKIEATETAATETAAMRDTVRQGGPRGTKALGDRLSASGF